jgi:EmrB/QacA subfamily drug resistance transporter
MEVSHMTDTDTEAPTQQDSRHREILLVYIALMLGMFLASLDQTIVSTALPTIVGELGGISHLSWVVTAYLLTSTTSAPLYGKLSDLYGRKLMFQIAIGVFLVGSLLCGFAFTMGQLIAYRAIQGLGAGGLTVMALTIIGDVVSPRERGRYQGYMGSVFAVSSVGGPLIGGFIVDNLDWRWVFFVNLPIGILAMAATARFLRLPVQRREHKIDYAGAALLVAGVTALLLVTVWGGSEYEWGSPQIIALSVAAAVLLTLFVFQESRAPEPILPLRLFRNRTFVITSTTGFILGLAMFGSIVFLPLFLQAVIGVTPTHSGLLLVPLMAGILTSSIISGRRISAYGRYKKYPVAGLAIAAVGLFLLSTMDTGTSLVISSLYMVILGTGMGLTMQVLVIAVQNAVEVHDLGVATSSQAFFRSLGGSFGTALFGAVMGSRLATALAGRLPDAGSIGVGDLTGSPEMIRARPDALQIPVIESLAEAVTASFTVAVPFAVAALAMIVFMPELPLRDQAHVSSAPVEL